MKLKHLKLFAVITAVVALCLIYYFVDPSGTAWVPQCPVKFLTGYSCPSCGAQRALHAAVHGNFSAAVRYNLFILIALPYLAAAVIASWTEGRAAIWVKRTLLSPAALYIYVALYVLWAVVRNLCGL